MPLSHGRIRPPLEDQLALREQRLAHPLHRSLRHARQPHPAASDPTDRHTFEKPVGKVYGGKEAAKVFACLAERLEIEKRAFTATPIHYLPSTVGTTSQTVRQHPAPVASRV